MKLKLLLFLGCIAGILQAQEPYRHLMITEAYTQRPGRNYCEITNMGDQTINLGEFKFGTLNLSHGRIYDVFNEPWVPQNTTPASVFMLPDVDLAPGETFLITGAYDFGPRQYELRPPGLGANERPMNPEWYDLADLLLHYPETNGDETDSITTGRFSYTPMNVWDGRNNYYLEHHFAEGDSAVVDQVGGVFDNDGRNFSQGYDVAGVENATANSILIRKAKFTSGNLDFANARGLGYDDSEWIVITYPSGYNSWRDVWWTVGNHGSYVLDANTLESDVIGVDYAAKKLTVPWGIRRLDGIMQHMEYKPGVAWYYHLNNVRLDSLYRSVRTGDTLEIIVAGDEKQTAEFLIEVSAPTTDANIVVPMAHRNVTLDPTTPIVGGVQGGILSWPRVTTHANGTDTITGSNHGLAYAMRTDTLLKYLEKPANANWEFVWVDGVERPDLKDGDKLKVTAENGDVKEYHIEVQPPSVSHSALLSAITWPDVPEYLKGIFGWQGDTIPGFSMSVTDYKLNIPLEVDGIPALVAKTFDLNANVEVKRAKSLTGTLEDRTVSFIVTAEDDSVTTTYNIELIKEKDPTKIQPFYADPFLSEFIYLDLWFDQFAEVVNPGNQPLDLSNYMLVMAYGSDPAAHISMNADPESWPNRYQKYIPGYKWVDETQWQVTPATVEPDLNINSIVQPGDVFAMGYINQSAENRFSYIVNYPQWTWGGYKVDINFSNVPGDPGLNRYNLQNPWGENPSRDGTLLLNPSNNSFMIFKILNDSVKQGLKPATDPNDFQLVDLVGNGPEVSGTWKINGKGFANRESWMRKPEVWKGTLIPGESFAYNGTWEESQWKYWNVAYWNSVGHPINISWFHTETAVAEDLGRHTMIEPTHYKSTVSSLVYKVSDGYSHKEQIRGVKTNTAVSSFLGNILKVDEGQTLKVKATADGSDLAADALLSNNDTLVVLSADSVNTTKYVLEVTEEGLNSDAVLTSTLYQVSVDVQPVVGDESVEAGAGTVSGFEYGTRLKTVLNNISVPMGATMDVVNSEGAYVSTKILNFDTTYVDVTVNSGIYLDVLAEDGLTRIVYQLAPTSTENDAFVLSDIYTVTQSTNLIQFIPGGTNVQTFLSNLVPAKDATVKLVDKMGHERTDGGIARDDKIVVTSANGQVTKVYHLSMLRTQYVFASDYLAYILSNTYSVDQVNYKVAGPTGSTMVSEFNSNITPAMGATAVVTDASGNEKTSGDLNQGDMVKVTSADGRIVVMYAIDFATSADKLAESKIQVYPNPTTGKVNIRGMEQGTRIQVFNQTGALIKDIKSSTSLETISLDNQPSGMYLVVLTKDARLITQHKLILR